MANTSAVYAHIDSNLKISAEDILTQLGISPSATIQMLYSPVVLTRSFPFQPVLPTRKPRALGNMTKSEIDAERAKGITFIRKGDVYTLEEWKGWMPY